MRFSGSGMCKSGISGDIAPRAVLSSLVGRPTMLGIMGGMARRTGFAPVRARSRPFSLFVRSLFALFRPSRRTALRFVLAVTCTRLVLLVTMHLALCSLG